MPNPLGRALRNRRAGHDTLGWARAELAAAENFVLTSPAFEHGSTIPAQYRGRILGKDLSPALAWTAPPPGTVELVLVVEDPDVPFGRAATHVLACGIDPGLREIPEGGLANPSPLGGLRHGRGVMGHRGWAGPMPVPSHGPHAYVFQLYAVDRPLGLPPSFGLSDVIRAVGGHVVGRARLDGMYENP
jgi:Raf kinase inhibitor-like YbhB/YbcL family protein